MTKCGGCHGTGKVRCSACHGRRYKSRLTGKGEFEMSPCLVCGGTGRMRHDFCHGRGYLGTKASGSRPTPRPRKKGEDVLAGRWNGSKGTWYEMVKQGNSYQVTEHGPLFQTGSGTATLSESIVTLEMTNVLLGTYTIQLRLEDDILRGTLSVLGFPVSMILTRG